MAFSRIVIDISEPCNEDWDSMEPVAGGRHCAFCAKTVVDFSRSSDEELFHFFAQEGNAHTCCRLREDQMKRDLQIVPTIRLWRTQWHKAAAVLLAVQSFALDAMAQKGKRPHQTVSAATNNKTRALLKGRVTAFSGGITKPLSFGLQIGQNNHVNIVTDSSGNFTFSLPVGFREGTISWAEVETEDGYIIPDSITVSRKAVPDLLSITWAPISNMQKVIIEAGNSLQMRTYSGLPTRDTYDLVPRKRPLHKRIAAWFHKRTR